ncbi:MAG TPA: retropepsin-like aspartic protease [Blastocatellia bacterium]|nr:retropepsin-like aspartic protease [Blastocatellia bacterium]
MKKAGELIPAQTRAVRLSLICGCLFVCLLTNGAALANASIPIKLIRGHLVVITVEVNGAGPFDFLLDTGTNTTVIHRELAQKLALRPIDRIVLVTAAGESVVPRSRLDRLSIGSATAANLEVLISDLRELRAQHPGISGIVGQNFLAQFNYLLSYRDRRLEFETGREFDGRMRGARLPVECDEGRVLVTTRLTSRDERPLRLALDSAAPHLILFQPLPDNCAPGSDLRAHSKVGIATTAGSRTVSSASLNQFEIGEERFADLQVILIPEQASRSGRIENGLLPTSLFHSLYVNHQQKYVIFNPAPLR